jgi:chaperone BCS1
MDLSTVMSSPSYAKAADAYKKAVTTVTAYTVLARELLPYELRDAARWAVSTVRDRLLPPPKPRRIKTILISRCGDGSHMENRFF